MKSLFHIYTKCRIKIFIEAMFYERDIYIQNMKLTLLSRVHTHSLVHTHTHSLSRAHTLIVSHTLLLSVLCLHTDIIYIIFLVIHSILTIDLVSYSQRNLLKKRNRQRSYSQQMKLFNIHTYFIFLHSIDNIYISTITNNLYQYITQ